MATRREDEAASGEEVDVRLARASCRAVAVENILMFGCMGRRDVVGYIDV